MAEPAAPRAPDTSSRALLKLAWPLFIANLAVVGNGTIDAVMAGRLSATDLAAVAVGSSVYITVYIGFMGVLQALSPIAGHHYGAQRWRAIGDDVQQALWLSLLLTAAGLPWVLATDLWIGFAQVDGEVGRVATLYLQAIAFGLPAALATRVFVALNAAVSRPKVTMLINVTALALKVPLNLVFMHGIGPVPALGGAGRRRRHGPVVLAHARHEPRRVALRFLLRALPQHRDARPALVQHPGTTEARRADRTVDACSKSRPSRSWPC